MRVTQNTTLKYRFRDEIQLQESEEAEVRIRAHPKCPFENFAFTGEASIDGMWYYIAADGPMQEAVTRVSLLRRES